MSSNDDESSGPIPSDTDTGGTSPSHVQPGDADADTEQGPSSDVRVITETDALKALAHPVRLALLEALLSGPLTATQAGVVIDESPTTCSFHLRQLAKYQFIEEAGGGKGRERRWRRVHQGWRIPVRADDLTFSESSRTVHLVLLDRYFKRIREAVLQLDQQTEQWQHATMGTESLFWVTAEEMQEVSNAFERTLAPFIERWGNRSIRPNTRPEGARAVEVLLFGVPVVDNAAPI